MVTVMKFWELSSIVRDDALLQSVAKQRPAWAELGKLYAQLGQLVQRQDRAVLDGAVSDDFVVAVLGSSPGKCWRSSDGWLRSFPASPGDEALTLVEAYRQYGGSMLESAFERGAVKV